MNLAQTLGLAAALIALGTWLTHRISLLSRLNIPPAVAASDVLRNHPSSPNDGRRWAIDLPRAFGWVCFFIDWLSASARKNVEFRRFGFWRLDGLRQNTRIANSRHAS